MRELKNGLNDCLLCFMFYFIIPLSSMIYLIGVFDKINNECYFSCDEKFNG